jgi:hypothetical protein
MNAAQRAKAVELSERLNCPDDWKVIEAPDLPAKWVSISVGETKGRPKVVDLDPKGIVQ